MNDLILPDEHDYQFTQDHKKTSSSCGLVPTVSDKNFPDISLGVNQYENAVRTIHLLTLEEEQQLAKDWHDKQDLNAACKMAYHHLRLVVATSRLFAGYGLNQEDLIQEGNIGLLKAVKKFDYTKGVRLSSWVLHWIRAEMQGYVIDNWRMVKIGSTKPRRKIFFNLRRLRKGTGFLKEEEALMIARELNVPIGDVRNMATRMMPDIALDAPLHDDDSEGTLMDVLASPEPDQDFFSEMADSGIIHESLQKLDPRSQDIVTSRWLDTDNPATLHELGAKYGVSAERIRQIEVGAMKKMKNMICAAV